MKNNQKTFIYNVLFFILFFSLTTTGAYAGLDAPHNAVNGYGCETCHDVLSPLAKMMPAMQYTPQDIDDTATNALCWSCHNTTIAPYKDTHSSIQTDNGYGPWTIECWVCHDQHQQTQNHLYGTSYGKLIRTPIRLENIIGVSKTGTKTVKFTSNTDFVQGSPNRNGICEVCHTLTLHFRNDGSLAVQGTHAGYEELTCTLCHKHNKGFVGSGDHSVFITDDNQTGDTNTKCSICHTGYATTPESAHHACSDCHTTPPTLVDSTFPNAIGQPDWDGAIGTMFQNLTDAASAPYTQYIYPGAGGRLQDDGSLFINDVGFKKIRCGECHAAKPDALVSGNHGSHPSSDWDYNLITNDCTDCHSDGGLGTIKGVHNDQCTLCHVDPSTGNYARRLGAGGDGDARLASDGTGDCLTCHPGATYPKPKIHHDTTNATATPTSNCTSACHNTTTGHAGNHNALVAIQSPPCQGCHGATPAVSGDNVPVDGTPGNLVHDYCTSCHVNPSNNLIETVATPTAHATTMNNPDGTTATNNGGGTCTACHTAYFNGHSHNHTFTATPACATCHGNPSPALTNARDAVSAPFVGAGEVHSALGCATCHNVASDGSLKGSAAGHALAAGCVDCHINGGTKTWSSVHTAALGTGPGTVDHINCVYIAAACATCHGNPTPGTSNARDAATTPFTAAGEVHSASGCVTCHTGANDGGLKSSPTKADTIAKGDCTTCHTVTSTWTTIHTAALGTVQPAVDHTGRVDGIAVCTQCHGNPTPVTSNARDAATTPFIAAGEVHNGSGCATCHTGADTGALNAFKPKADAIAKGTCATCHTVTSTWTTIHDTATGAVTGVSHATRVDGLAACTACHTATAGGPNGLIPVDSGNNQVHDACSTCHTASGLPLQSTPTPNGWASALSRGDCGTCHGANYFDSHVHGTSSGYVWHDVTYNSISDISQVSFQPGPNPCGNCHNGNNADGNGTPLDSWTDILSEHVTGCSRCHSYVDDGKHTPPQATSDNTIASGTGITCTTCHTPKLSPELTSDHGHQDTDFGWAGDCQYCHGAGAAAEAVVRQIHSNNCDLCHTTGGPYDKTTNKVGANGNGDATLAEGAADATTPFDSAIYTCTTCHNQAQVPGFHGTTIAEVYSSHQLSSDSSGGYDCESCHSTNKGNEQLSTHMPADTVVNCSAICHNNTTPSATSAKVAHDVINAVTFLDPAPNQNNTKCEDCHAAKGDYRRHGMTDDASVSDGIGDGTGGLVFHDKLGNSTGQAAVFTGRLAGAYGGLKVSSYNCGDCHAADPNTKAISSLEAMQLHTSTNGTGHGNCLTCHVNAASVADEIAAGEAGTVQNCENCHSTANGNGPSGEKMYQYDGVRHHKTANAQAGQCTYCHADPRPSVVTSGYAATADIVGTYNSGFIADYSSSTPSTPPTPAIPTQPACRLCHTNYEIWSTDVYVDQDNNSSYTDTVDLHGYHINGQATGYNNTGLTVYADDYSPLTVGEAGGSYPSGTSSRNVRGPVQVTQSAIHRIDPNTGTTKIIVQNYGACFGCHSVQIFHAAPNSDTPWSDYTAPNNNVDSVPYDTLRYAPGRSIFNLLPGSNCGNTGATGGNNNDSWDQHCEQEKFNNRAWRNQRGQDLMDNTFNKNPSTDPALNEKFFDVYNTANWTQADIPGDTMSNFESLPGISTTGALYSSHGGGVPVFTNYPTLPTIDDLVITMAKYTGSAIVVHATSSIGSGQTVSFTYTGGGCGTITMNWVTDHYEGTCATPSAYTAGTDTVTVSNTTTVSPLDTRTRLVADNSGPVATVAVNDSYTAQINAVSQLLVLSNDQGTHNAVISTNDTNLNANCSTAVAGGGTRVDITCGAATGAMGTFDYIVVGDLNSDTGTVTITTSANTPPTITVNQPDGVSDTGFTGGSFTINYDANDVDGGDTISVDFYYDNNNSGSDGTTIASCQNLSTKGAGLTCNWTSLPVGTWYVYGIVDDGTTTTTDYSSGTIVVTNPAVTLLDAWAVDSNGPGNLTSSFTVSAGTNRVLVVAITAEDTNSAANIGIVYYGGTAAANQLTQVQERNQGNGYANVAWIGYCDETCLAAAGNTTITESGGGADGGMFIQAASYQYVNQTTPVFASNGNTSTSSPISTSVNTPVGGQVIYAVNFNDGTNSLSNPGAGYTVKVDENFAPSTTEFSGAVATRDATTAASPANITATAAKASNRTAIVTMSLNPQ